MRLESRLEDTLVCSPGQHDGPMSFELGAQKWLSDGTNSLGDVPRCTVDDWTFNVELLQKVSISDTLHL